MKVFLDTNILIDYIAQRNPFFQNAEKFIVMQELGDCELWVSSESFTDTFYVLKKAIEPKPLQTIFSHCINQLNIASVGLRELKNALLENWEDFEDALIYTSAQSVKADFLITRDKNGFTNAKIPVFSPAEFFDMLKVKHGIEYDMQDL